MRLVVAVGLTALIGCRTEGGVAFDYKLYAASNLDAPAVSCSQIGVSRIRFMIGNAYSDGLLQDYELEGRAVQDCTAGSGRFETESDRLPVGEYTAVAVSLVLEVGSTITTVPSRPFGVSEYSQRWTYGNPNDSTILTITEGEVTSFSFAPFDGGMPELRLITQ